MKTLGYCSPLVPPEWIAAHGLQPRWLPWAHEPGVAASWPGRGLCPFAGQAADAIRAGTVTDAIVLTTTCDQMRRVAGLVQHGAMPIFLANIPATWQTEASRAYYVEELRRLGRWLIALGGSAPTGQQLAAVMRRYEAARAALLARQDCMSARQFSEAILAIRCGEISGGDLSGKDISASSRQALTPADGGIRLAILGGPLAPRDFDLFDLVEAGGGKVVLDATDAGPRTLPAAFDARSIDEDPLVALADAYFTSIPDIFRRPNDGLYRWLAGEIASRAVRGILFRRYVWCDLWHAELFRLKQWSPVPLLEIDVVGDEGSSLGRNSGRLEALLEMLR